MGRASLRARAKRATTLPSEIIQDRQDAISQMNHRLLVKMQQIERGMSDTRSDNLRWYYDLGNIVRDIRENPETYAGKDGTNGLKLLERALSTQARTLRRAATFREAYSPAEFERLIGLENTDTHFQLHWGHVNYLLSVENVEQRWQFAAEACSKMLSPPDLHAYIKRRLGRGGGHGRKHTVPATVRGQLRQIEQATSGWNTKQAQVWDGDDVNVLSNLLKVAPDDVDEELLQHLQATRDGFLEMAENATKNAQQFERVIERVSKILDNQKRAAAAAEASRASANGRKQRSIELDNDPPGKRRTAVAH